VSPEISSSKKVAIKTLATSPRRESESESEVDENPLAIENLDYLHSATDSQDFDWEDLDDSDDQDDLDDLDNLEMLMEGDLEDSEDSEDSDDGEDSESNEGDEVEGEVNSNSNPIANAQADAEAEAEGEAENEDDDESSDSFGYAESDSSSDEGLSKPLRPLRPTISTEKDIVSIYQGHRNVRTMLKQADFFGPYSEFVMSGSDEGAVLFWDANTCELINVIRGDTVSFLFFVLPLSFLFFFFLFSF